MIYISIILYCIGGIFDAVMDTLSDHFSISVFKHLNPSYWNKNISWTNKYVDGIPSKGYRRVWGIVIPAAFTDAWHLCKSLKEVVVCIALSLALYVDFPYNTDIILLYFVIAGLSRNIIFDLFYNNILLSKK